MSHTTQVHKAMIGIGRAIHFTERCISIQKCTFHKKIPKLISFICCSDQLYTNNYLDSSIQKKKMLMLRYL